MLRVRKICLFFALVFSIKINAMTTSELRIKHNIEVLRRATFQPANHYWTFIRMYKVPMPLPHMHVGWCSPLESLDLFEVFAKSQFNPNLTFEQNWVFIVRDFNEIHKSLPIAIPKKSH